jgi:DNA polymerase-3 subunit delta
MKTLRRTELERALREKIQPLYLLLGSETFLRGLAAQEITDAALRESPLREFNESSFSLFSDSVQSAIAAAEQLPMMSPLRVVRIRDFAKLREADEETLIRYVSNPSPSTVMILIASELDKRKKATKALLDHCWVVDFSPLKDVEAKSWAQAYLKKLNVIAPGPVISEILNLVGTDLQSLSSELEKLAAAASEKGQITMQMVDDLIGHSRELSNFTLGDQIMAKDRKRALETLHRLLADGAEPVMLLGLIASNYHRLALAKDLLTRGGPNEVFRKISMPPFKKDSYLKTLQRTDLARVSHGIQLIAAADLAIKTSQGTPRLQLEMLVCSLVQ